MNLLMPHKMTRVSRSRMLVQRNVIFASSITPWLQNRIQEVPYRQHCLVVCCNSLGIILVCNKMPQSQSPCIRNTSVTIQCFVVIQITAVVFYMVRLGDDVVQWSQSSWSTIQLSGTTYGNCSQQYRSRHGVSSYIVMGSESYHEWFCPFWWVCIHP